MRSNRCLSTCLVAMTIALGGLTTASSAETGRILYIQSSHISEGQNSILGFSRLQ